MRARPDFIIIGAMKCATTTLHDQLAAQPGTFMSEPKEPNFFSDDGVYARGEAWYASLFAAAPPGAVRGESSTHYTKLPTHPRSVERMARLLPGARLIYIMREPIQRLVSQYIHEWTMRNTAAPIDRAIDELPALVDYGRYAMQLRPYLETYGPERILPVFFERLTAHPQPELERIARFIGLEGPVRWDAESARSNASSRRLRRSTLRDAVVYAPVLGAIRRGVVPKGVRERVKSLWTMRDRPALSPAVAARLREIYDADLAELGGMLGAPLSCATFRHAVTDSPLDWCAREPAAADFAAHSGGGVTP